MVWTKQKKFNKKLLYTKKCFNYLYPASGDGFRYKILYMCFTTSSPLKSYKTKGLLNYFLRGISKI